MTLTGYLHPAYADALREWGTPLPLRRSGGVLLRRTIQNSDALDAMGCYPLFLCDDWTAVCRDLDEVGQHLVSVVLVTDPFADPVPHSATFSDLLRPFKEHFVADLAVAPEDYVHRHHLRNARIASSKVTTRFVEPTPAVLEEWCRLYRHLVARHNICGLPAFSRVSFQRQFEVPGLSAQTAELNGEVVGMVLWYSTASRVYYHLGAYSDLGYELRASFAIFRHALSHFAQSGLRWLCLGAGAGTTGNANDGLTRFKRGWSTGTRTAYLCGRVFDSDRYRGLCNALGTTTVPYFPAYRYGEFR
jgi:hypothetical protein